jgi:hypothetical protein
MICRLGHHPQRFSTHDDAPGRNELSFGVSHGGGLRGRPTSRVDLVFVNGEVSLAYNSEYTFAKPTFIQFGPDLSDLSDLSP